ncbi:MAG TPA: hypothetical protein VN577_21240 [Terriglobales bacterium]|nr:hypothetical protein [Terriglobales bacterium]
MTLRPAIAVVIWLLAIAAQAQCNGFSFKGRVEAGQDFEKPIGNALVFQLEATESGWMIYVVPQKHADEAVKRDYIYPVNPPLRSNPLQYLQRAFDQSARELLSLERDLRFVTNQSDFEKANHAVQEALWPGSAEGGEQNAAKYLEQMKALPLGSLHYKPVAFQVSEEDRPEWLEFEITVSVPAGFKIPAGVSRSSVSCPPSL